MATPIDEESIQRLTRFFEDGDEDDKMLALADPRLFRLPFSELRAIGESRKLNINLKSREDIIIEIVRHSINTTRVPTPYRKSYTVKQLINLFVTPVETVDVPQVWTSKKILIGAGADLETSEGKIAWSVYTSLLDELQKEGALKPSDRILLDIPLMWLSLNERSEEKALKTYNLLTNQQKKLPYHFRKMTLWQIGVLYSTRFAHIKETTDFPIAFTEPPLLKDYDEAIAYGRQEGFYSGDQNRLDLGDGSSRSIKTPITMMALQESGELSTTTYFPNDMTNEEYEIVAGILKVSPGISTFGKKQVEAIVSEETRLDKLRQQALTTGKYTTEIIIPVRVDQLEEVKDYSRGPIPPLDDLDNTIYSYYRERMPISEIIAVPQPSRKMFTSYLNPVLDLNLRELRELKWLALYPPGDKAGGRKSAFRFNFEKYTEYSSLRTVLLDSLLYISEYPKSMVDRLSRDYKIFLLTRSSLPPLYNWDDHLVRWNEYYFIKI